MVLNNIINLINNSNGWISFDRYMLEALYLNNKSYYVKNYGSINLSPFGESGDFVTAPSYGPWLAKAIARRFMNLVKESPKSFKKSLVIREFGPGTGQLALDILVELDGYGCLPYKYEFFDVSYEMVKIQKKTIINNVNKLNLNIIKKICSWNVIKINENFIPKKYQNFKGLLIANEVVDSFPVKLFSWTPSGTKNNKILEHGVSSKNNRLFWDSQHANSRLSSIVNHRRKQALSRGQVWENERFGEWSLYLAKWCKKILKSLDWGDLVIIDYGLERTELDRPNRIDSTISAFTRHHQINNLDKCIENPGAYDLTHQVDFTEMIETFSRENIKNIVLKTQAAWLIDSGILEDVENFFSNESSKNKFIMIRNLQSLLLDSEMGQSFLVLDVKKREITNV